MEVNFQHTIYLAGHCVGIVADTFVLFVRGGRAEEGGEGGRLWWGAGGVHIIAEVVR